MFSARAVTVHAGYVSIAAACERTWSAFSTVSAVKRHGSGANFVAMKGAGLPGVRRMKSHTSSSLFPNPYTACKPVSGPEGACSTDNAARYPQP